MSVIHTIKKSDILRFLPGSSVNFRLEKVGILALLGLAGLPIAWQQWRL